MVTDKKQLLRINADGHG